MSLALREIRRAAFRFALLTAAIGLLLFLILFQQALRDGLVNAFVGAIRTQSAPVLVFSTDGQRTLQGSVIPPPLEDAIASARGIGSSGWIGQGTFTVRIGEDAGTSQAAIIGATDPALGGIETVDAGRVIEARGQAIGSSADFSLGDQVRVVPVGGNGEGGPVLEVVGLVDGAQLQVDATLFVVWDDYEAAARVANPDATTILPNAIGLRPADGVTAEALVEAVAAVSDDVEPLTRDDAADRAPGVTQVRQSFQVIFLLYGLVVPLITGLFFLIVTFQKAKALTLLRAVGVSSATLVRSLLAQVVMVIGAGVVVGTVLYLPVSQLRVGTIQLRFDPGAATLWAALLMVLGVLSALGAARRVLRIDPIEAASGGGER